MRMDTLAAQSADFLVVGGGPAGSAFAMLAARAGASVVLLERDDYRQRRPGEHLAGRIRPMLDALHVSRERADDIAVPSPGVRSAWSTEGSRVKLYRAAGHAVGVCVVRHRFDELLCRSAREAGVQVMLRVRAMRVERLRSGTWAATVAGPDGQARTISAPSIVDASGRRAWIARSQGSRRVNYGDLLAIVRWFDVDPLSRTAEDTMMTVESCPYGWWSLSVAADQTLIATLFTSRDLMRRARATADSWWTTALASTRRAADLVRDCRGAVGATALYPASPSRSSQLAGDGWIAIGDAAISLDPLAGQGVAVALETAFRAFEAARADPSWARLAPDYRDALLSRLQVHLDGRTQVYEEAAGVLPEIFLNAAVRAGVPRATGSRPSAPSSPEVSPVGAVHG